MMMTKCREKKKNCHEQTAAAIINKNVVKIHVGIRVVGGGRGIEDGRGWKRKKLLGSIRKGLLFLFAVSHVQRSYESSPPPVSLSLSPRLFLKRVSARGFL